MTAYSIFTTSLEISPERLARLREVIGDTFPTPGAAEMDAARDRMGDALPMLHFLAITIFEDQHYDPLLLIEVNTDHGRGPFWAAMDDAYGETLREILRCAKRPRTRHAPLYDAITAEGSRHPTAALMEAMSIGPSVGYRGARRFSRDRIERERAIYDAAQEALGDGAAAAGRTARETHADLRKTLAGQLGPEEDPRPWAPSPWDWTIFAFAILMIIGCTVFFGLWGAALSMVIDPVWLCGALAVALFAMMVCWDALSGADRDLPAITKIPKWLIGLAAVVISCILGWLAWHIVQGGAHALKWLFGDAVSIPSSGVEYWVVLFLAGVLTWGAGFAWLRRLEAADANHTGAADPPEMPAIRAAEDIDSAQNHMTSLLTIKPGMQRTAVLRLSHMALRALAQTQFSDGYLGRMRTIHFAHWAILNRGSRLAFASNFDGSWDSYLSDFTEKASTGVNLAWSQCVGFPPGRYVIFGGSERGDLFKRWARHSMAPNLFWFNAYPGLTVGDIHRNARFAAGLRQPELDDPAAWARDL